MTFVIVMLLLATLACSLTTADLTPTQTPTTNATLFVTQTQEAINTLSAPRPTTDDLQISVDAVSPTDGSTIVHGDTIIMNVTATHETGASLILLTPKLVSPIPGGAPIFRPIALELPGDEPIAERTLEWSPDAATYPAGDYELSISAILGSQSSAPAVLNFTLEEVVVVDADGTVIEPTVDLGPCLVTLNAGGVAMHTAPSPSSSVIMTLRQGQTGEGVGRNRDDSGQGWFYVVLDDDPENREGWIIASRLDREGGCSDAEIPLRD